MAIFSVSNWCLCHRRETGGGGGMSSERKGRLCADFVAQIFNDDCPFFTVPHVVHHNFICFVTFMEKREGGGGGQGVQSLE